MGGACEILADKMQNLGIDDLVIACDECPPGEESSSDSDGTVRICSFPLLPDDLTRIVMRSKSGSPAECSSTCGQWRGCISTNYGGGLLAPLNPRAKPAMCFGSNTYYFLGVASLAREGTYVLWHPPTGELRSRPKPPNVSGGTILIASSTYWMWHC